MRTNLGEIFDPEGKLSIEIDLSASHPRRCLYRLENEGLAKRLERDVRRGKMWTWRKRKPID